MNTPFTELPIPKRTEEYIVIVKKIEIVESHFCRHLIGSTELTRQYCGLHTTWQCAICNQWTCDLHEKKGQYHNPPGELSAYSICESCGKLSRDEQRKVYAFQTEMNEE